MELAQPHPISDDVVLQRTAAGQRALVFDGPDGTPEQRLLAMLNGYTPLGTFMRLGVDEQVARSAAQRLVAKNLAAKASRSATAT